MKVEMRNEGDGAQDAYKQKMAEHMTARNKRADRLVEEWSDMPGVGEGLQESYDKNPAMIRNTAIVLENTANEFTKMTETQVSSSYNGLTPENALRVIRLGYPNANRGKAFYEFAMETAEDGMWYLSPVYSSTARGATADDVMHESDAYRYASLEELDTPTQTPNGAIVTFTGSNAGALANPPLKPFFVRVYFDDVIVGSDNGLGVISGAGVVGGVTYTITAGTVNYTTGAISVTFDVAPPTGTTLRFSYIYDYEDPAQYTDLGEVELRLRKVNFKLRSYRLGISWSKQSELVLGTTLNIDAEEALIKGAAEELRKSLDFEAFKLGYRVALGNGAGRTFDTDYLSAGADSAKAHAQTLHRVFEDTADDIRATINRGGYSSIVCGAGAANYISTYLDGFSDAGAETEIGIYQIGTYRGRPVFKVPRTSIMPTNEVYTVWNNIDAGDYSLGFGVLLPMYTSPKLEFKNMNSEFGMAEWGDHRILQSQYIRRVTLSNLDRY